MEYSHPAVALAFRRANPLALAKRTIVPPGVPTLWPQRAYLSS
jgi:hypothetical protein